MPIQRRTPKTVSTPAPPSARRPPRLPLSGGGGASRSRPGRGLGLFLLGVLVGGLGTWAGCPDALLRQQRQSLAALVHGTGSARDDTAEGAAASTGSGSAASRASAAAQRHGAGRRSTLAGGANGTSPGGTSPSRLAAPAGADRESVGSEDVPPWHAGAAAGAAAPAGARIPAGGAVANSAGGAPEGGRPAGPLREPAATRIALVIDDLGRSLGDIDQLERLGAPVTFAVLPFESQTPEVVAALRRRHEEYLCHLPMEPRNGGNPGPGALRSGMSRDELRQATLAALRAVPGAAGVNNHMGSGLSADAPSMAAILGVIGAQGLFFLDSRTSAQSVAYRLATSLGVPAAERQVFLDDDLAADAVAAQFQHLLELARTRGEAIAIGHPHPATLAILAAAVPRAQADGYRFVRVSALLDRPAAAPVASAAPASSASQ